MKIVVAATAEQKKGFVIDEKVEAEIIWVNKSSDFSAHADADAYVDLLFDVAEKHYLESLLPKTVIINSVEHMLAETNGDFVRINGWPGFLQGSMVEAAAGEQHRAQAEGVMQSLGKKIKLLPDVAGFVAPRVVCMIINEAYLALDEGVSTKAEIDTAMKLGTAYPFGPFEWAEKMGIKKVAGLLQNLAKDEKRYQPAPLLLKDAG